MKASATRFEQPSGIVGRLGGTIMGKIMARGNMPMNRFTFSLMQVQPEDCILEVGFGPGELLALLAARATRGVVAGVDPSETMIEMAAGRNRTAIQQGRMQLREGVIAAIPYPDGSFTTLCTVNTIYVCHQPEDDLRDLYRVLAPGGTAYITFRTRHAADGALRVRSFRKGYFDGPVARVVAALERIGFTGVRYESRKLSNVEAACVIAHRAP